VTANDLEKCEPPEAVLDKISQEIIQGEQRLAQDGSTFALIKARMSFGAKFNEARWKEGEGNKLLEKKSESRVAASALPGVNAEPNDTVPSKKTGKARPRRNGKAFERAPARDKVGEGRNNRIA